MKILNITYPIVLLILLFLSSCEREIAIDLNKSNPRYVIEGNFSNDINDTTKIIISSTLNFDQTIPYPKVSGAFVTITDTLTNKIDTLNELQPGVYGKIPLTGAEGHTYKMYVKIGTDTFVASSTMPYSQRLDSLIQLNLAGTVFPGGPPAGTPAAGKIIQLLPVYQKSVSADKYYQYVIARNDTLLNRIVTGMDVVSNPIPFTFPLFLQANKNDTISLDMRFMDKTAYKYLMEISANVGQFSATPSNPFSNISNGALGFFKAHTSQKKVIVIK